MDWQAASEGISSSGSRSKHGLCHRRPLDRGAEFCFMPGLFCSSLMILPTGLWTVPAGRWSHPSDAATLAYGRHFLQGQQL